MLKDSCKIDFSPFIEVVPGAGSLLQYIDGRIFVWLRDGRMFVGSLRSVDQFANLVLCNAWERIQIGKSYGDIPQGIIMVRGENVALLGELSDKEDDEDGKRHQAIELLSPQLDQVKSRKKTDKQKELAYWQRGLVYTAEDYF